MGNPSLPCQRCMSWACEEEEQLLPVAHRADRALPIRSRLPRRRRRKSKICNVPFEPLWRNQSNTWNGKRPQHLRLRCWRRNRWVWAIRPTREAPMSLPRRLSRTPPRRMELHPRLSRTVLLHLLLSRTVLHLLRIPQLRTNLRLLPRCRIRSQWILPILRLTQVRRRTRLCLLRHRLLRTRTMPLLLPIRGMPPQRLLLLRLKHCLRRTTPVHPLPCRTMLTEVLLLWMIPLLPNLQLTRTLRAVS
mmetsp:Transcript_20876/g.45265  ORF Transcript_20876/g.45265 Transcript_20876/m.45265 type:complete len:247 (+) Transcript_20876:436-1176(+)